MPSPIANSIIEQAERVVVLVESRIDNTISHPYHFEDSMCGNVGMCGNASEFIVQTNSKVAISNVGVPHLSTNLSLTGRVQISREIGEPFAGSLTTVSYSNVVIKNDLTPDDFENRMWEDSPATISIGGLLNKGTDQQVLLSHEDFEPIMDGRFGSHQSTINDINIPILPISDELSTQFPPLFEYGDSEGRAKPYILGQVFGYSPYRVQGTLRMFHCGDVDVVAHEYERPPFIYYGRGIEVLHGSAIGLALESNSNFDGTGLISETEFEFNQEENTAVSNVNGLQITASADGDGVELVAFADGFTIRRTNGEGIQRYTYPQFSWVRRDDDGDNVVIVDSGLSDAVVTLGGDIEFVDIGGSWFRAAGAGSGVVEVDFGERNIHSARLVLRAIRNPFQTVEFLDNQPVSITPEFQDDGEVYNHVCVFRDLDTGKIRFNYNSTSSGANFALWFEEVSLADPTPAKITIDFDKNVASIEFDYAPDGSMQIQNFSQATFESLSNDNPDVITYQTSAAGAQYNQYTFDLVISSGLAVITLNQIQELSSTYGTFRTEGGYILRPPPEIDFNDPFNGPTVVGGFAGLSAFIEDETQAFNAGVRYEYQARMRVIEGDLDTVNVELSYPALRNVVVGREWTDINIIINNVNGNNLIVRAQTRRGGDEPQNDNVDFAVEVDFVKCHLLGNGVSDFPLYENTNGADVRIPTFRVKDARIYNKLPTGIAFYDDKGRIAVSEEYADVHGDFIGRDRNETSISAFSQISLAAKGVDYLDTTDFAGSGEIMSHVLDEQRPFFQHIMEIGDSLDYIISEFEVGLGFLVRRRFDFDQQEIEFEIQEEEIELNSIRRNGSVPRQYRYDASYRRNHRNERLTFRSSSPIGYTGNFNPKTIEMPIRRKSDVDRIIGNAIPRDSVPNDLRTMVLTRPRLDLLEGMAGRIYHPRIPKNNICIIRRVTTLLSLDGQPSTTSLLIKLLRL